MPAKVLSLVLAVVIASGICLPATTYATDGVGQAVSRTADAPEEPGVSPQETLYTITYNANGAEGDVPLDADGPYAAGSTATVAGNTAGDPLHMDGALFFGWNTEADGSGTRYAAGSTFDVEDDAVLYAMWLNFDVTVAQPEAEILRPGQILTYTLTVTVPTAVEGLQIDDRVPQHTSYLEGSASPEATFANGHVVWTPESLDVGEQATFVFFARVDADAPAGTIISNNATLRCADETYSSNSVSSTVGDTFRVTYDANGSTGNVPTDIARYAAAEQATVLGNVGSGATPEPLSEPNGTFIGWNTAADGTGTHYDAGDVISLSADVTLYAQFISGDMTCVKSDPSATVKPGETLEYTVTIRVPEGAAAFTFTDPIPASTEPVDGSFAGGVTLSGDEVVRSATNLPADSTLVFSFRVKIDDDAAVDTVISNEATYTVDGTQYRTNTVTKTVGPTYTIAYEANGATGGAAPVDEYRYGADQSAEVPANTGADALTRDAFGFAGWNTQADGSGTHYDADDTASMADGDVTLYAMWVGARKIAIQPDALALCPGDLIDYNIIITVPEHATTMTVEDGLPAGTRYVPGTASSGGTFVGDKVSWTVTDLPAGAQRIFNFKAEVVATGMGTVIDNSAVIDIDGSGFVTTTTSNTVADTHRITYVANAAVSGDVPVDGRYYPAGTDAVVAGNSGSGAHPVPMSATGLSFAGWNTAADGTGTHYDAGDAITVDSDITLYAMWVMAVKTSVQSDAALLRPGDTIRYTVDMAVPEAASDVSIVDTVPANTTLVEGGIEDGGVDSGGKVEWSIGSLAAGQHATVHFTVKVDSTAVFRTVIANTAGVDVDGVRYATSSALNTVGETHTIIYDANGGSGSAPVDGTFYAAGATATVKDNGGDDPMTKTGCIFIGWNTAADGTGTSVAPGDALSMNSDIRLYAMWLGVSKRAVQPAGDLLKPGDTIDYSIAVTAPVDVSWATVTDTVPEHTTFVSADGPGSSLSGSVITWQVGPMSAGTTVTLTFSVSVEDAAAGTVIRNTAEVDIDGTAYQTNTTTNVVGEAWRVFYHGNGSTGGDVPVDPRFYGSTETAVVASDFVEAEDEIEVAGDGGTTLSKNGARFIGWNTAADGTGTHYDPGDSLTIAGNVDLYAMWLTITVSSERIDGGNPLYPGKGLHYDIAVVMPEDAAGVVISDALPDMITFSPGSASVGVIYDDATKTLKWAVGQAHAGQRFALSFDARVNGQAHAGDIIADEAVVVTESVSVRSDADIRVVEDTPAAPKVAKSVDADHAFAGGTLTYTIHVANESDEPSARIIVRDAIPRNTVFVSSQAGAYDAGSGSITWLIPELAARNTMDLSFTVRIVDAIPDGSTIDNIAYSGASPDLPLQPAAADLKAATAPTTPSNRVTTSVSSEAVAGQRGSVLTTGVTPTASSTTAGRSATPATGDTTLYLAVGIIALAAMSALVYRRRRVDERHSQAAHNPRV